MLFSQAITETSPIVQEAVASWGSPLVPHHYAGGLAIWDPRHLKCQVTGKRCRSSHPGKVPACQSLLGSARGDHAYKGMSKRATSSSRPLLQANPHHIPDPAVE